MLRYLLPIIGSVIVSVLITQAQQRRETFTDFLLARPAASSLSGSELIPIIQGGVTKKIPVSALGGAGGSIAGSGVTADCAIWVNSTTLTYGNCLLAQ